MPLVVSGLGRAAGAGCRDWLGVAALGAGRRAAALSRLAGRTAGCRACRAGLLARAVECMCPAVCCYARLAAWRSRVRISAIWGLRPDPGFGSWPFETEKRPWMDETRTRKSWMDGIRTPSGFGFGSWPSGASVRIPGSHLGRLRPKNGPGWTKREPGNPGWTKSEPQVVLMTARRVATRYDMSPSTVPQRDSDCDASVHRASLRHRFGCVLLRYSGALPRRSHRIARTPPSRRRAATARHAPPRRDGPARAAELRRPGTQQPRTPRCIVTAPARDDPAHVAELWQPDT